MENESFYKWRLAKILGLGDAETPFPRQTFKNNLGKHPNIQCSILIEHTT